MIVGTRAEDIVADEIGNDETIDGTINVCCVSNVEFQGNDSYLFLELEKQEELVVKGTENHWRKQENLEKVHVSFFPGDDPFLIKRVGKGSMKISVEQNV